MARAAEPTLAPSARRVAEARRQGRVAVSRELTGALALAAAFAVIALAAPAALAGVVAYLREAVAAAFVASTGVQGSGGASAIAGGAAAQALAAGHQMALRLLALPVGVAALVALAAGLAQTRALVTLAPLRPSARSGWRPGDALGAAALASFKVAAVALAAFVVLRGSPRALPGLVGAPPSAVLAALAVLSLRLGSAAVAAALALAALDFALAWRRHQRALRMTPDEARRETRDTEGDPAQRAARRRTHREAVDAS